MPWKEIKVTDQRVKFVAELLKEEETMTELCSVFGISRKTGYKWRDRYECDGPASPPASTLALQRLRFVKFKKSFNDDRPHQALNMKTPRSIYTSSKRLYPRTISAITYGERYIVRPIRGNGTVRWKGSEVFISEVLTGYKVGLLACRRGGSMKVYWGTLDLGTLDNRTLRFKPKSAS